MLVYVSPAHQSTPTYAITVQPDTGYQVAGSARLAQISIASNVLQILIYALNARRATELELVDVMCVDQIACIAHLIQRNAQSVSWAMELQGAVNAMYVRQDVISAPSMWLYVRNAPKDTDLVSVRSVFNAQATHNVKHARSLHAQDACLATVLIRSQVHVFYVQMACVHLALLTIKYVKHVHPLMVLILSLILQLLHAFHAIHHVHLACRLASCNAKLAQLADTIRI